MAKKKTMTRRIRLRSVLGHEYPVGESLAKVERAGGLHNMTAEQVAALDMKKVLPGGWCDDMPEGPRAAFLRRGKVEEVEVDARGNPLKRITTRKAGG